MNIKFLLSKTIRVLLLLGFAIQSLAILLTIIAYIAILTQ